MNIIPSITMGITLTNDSGVGIFLFLPRFFLYISVYPEIGHFWMGTA